MSYDGNNSSDEDADVSVTEMVHEASTFNLESIEHPLSIEDAIKNLALKEISSLDVGPSTLPADDSHTSISKVLQAKFPRGQFQTTCPICHTEKQIEISNCKNCGTNIAEKIIVKLRDYIDKLLVDLSDVNDNLNLAISEKKSLKIDLHERHKSEVSELLKTISKLEEKTESLENKIISQKANNISAHRNKDRIRKVADNQRRAIKDFENAEHYYSNMSLWSFGVTCLCVFSGIILYLISTNGSHFDYLKPVGITVAAVGIAVSTLSSTIAAFIAVKSKSKK